MGRLRLVVALGAGGLVLAMLPAMAVSAEPGAGEQVAHAAATSARRAGALSVSPGTYVGGQAITFAGTIGTPGRRKITLQLHMNRPGDSWFPVRGFAGTKTASDGSFSFQFQAPSMFGIRYRVVSGRRATPPVTFNARIQDITTWIEGTDARGLPANTAVAGKPFTVMVNAAPGGAPAFVGRGLTLQKRIDGDTWEDLARSSVGADGGASFPGVAPPPGTFVYRVKADDIVTGANRIGWIQTFPTYVTVVETAPTPTPTPTETQTPTARIEVPVTARRSGASATASGRFGWYPILYDYTWEAGQSLTSAAEIGSEPGGWWLDYADGAGRVAKHNGGLLLDSQRGARGDGDFGTTRATLMDSSRTYGRWEARVRMMSGESDDSDFTGLVELVPARVEDYACGRRNITLAEVTASGTSVRFGVKADDRQWMGSRTIPSLVRSAPAVAVEVSKSHITWFWDGKPIGTVKGGAAVSDVPMTLRFSLVGDQAGEYDKTGLHSDWQRAFDIGSGKRVRNGPGLTSSALTACES